MQWFKSAIVISSVGFVAAMTANGCSSTPKGGGDSGNPDSPVTGPDSSKKETGGGPHTGTCASGPWCENCDNGFPDIQQGKPTQVLNACTSNQLQAFVTACFSSTASTATCTAW